MFAWCGCRTIVAIAFADADAAPPLRKAIVESSDDEPFFFREFALTVGVL